MGGSCANHGECHAAQGCFGLWDSRGGASQQARRCTSEALHQGVQELPQEAWDRLCNVRGAPPPAPVGADGPRHSQLTHSWNQQANC